MEPIIKLVICHKSLDRVTTLRIITYTNRCRVTENSKLLRDRKSHVGDQPDESVNVTFKSTPLTKTKISHF